MNSSTEAVFTQIRLNNAFEPLTICGHPPILGGPFRHLINLIITYLTSADPMRLSPVYKNDLLQNEYLFNLNQ